MHDQFNEDDSVETHPVPDVDPVQDFGPPLDSFTTGRLPQTEQENQEYNTTATIHTTAEPVVHSTAIPPTISTSVLTAIPSGKIFPRCLLRCYTSIIDGYFGAWPPSSFF